jgi:FAD:protein FMN transferase
LKKYYPYIILFVILFVAGFLMSLESEKDGTIKRTNIIMGTVVEIQVREKDKEKADKAITEAFNEIRRIDNLFTTYDSSSPVFQLNNSDEAVEVDDEVYKIMEKSEEMWKLTGGKFDAAVENIVKLWGFDIKESYIVPSEEELKRELSRSGWNNIRLEGNNRVVRTNNAEVSFGAIAKGYAVDKAAEVLRKNGITEGLVNAGGEIAAFGGEWVIGIQHPRVPSALVEKIKLNNKSVATSGDYENYFIDGERRYHHIIDPATGYPGSRNQSVSIIAENDMFADALSTGIFLMEREEGISLIERLEGVEGMVIDSNGNKFYSSGFNNYLTRD